MYVTLIAPHSFVLKVQVVANVGMCDGHGRGHGVWVWGWGMGVGVSMGGMGMGIRFISTF